MKNSAPRHSQEHPGKIPRQRSDSAKAAIFLCDPSVLRALSSIFVLRWRITFMATLAVCRAIDDSPIRTIGPMSEHGTPVHSVHFYNESAGLISLLCAVVSSSLRRGDSVLIIPTSEHRVQLVQALQTAGIDVRPHARAGRYTMIDAEELLSSFMRHEIPDRQLFRRALSGILNEAVQSARSNPRRLMAFGEMVAVLWNRGNKEAALRLEQLWSEILRDHPVFLLCAYPRSAVRRQSDEAAVCSTHSHLLEQVA